MMKEFAILSDIHGNVTALEAVLADIKKHNLSHIFCLGDIVGKGPSNAACIDLIRQNCETVLRGNWDKIAAQSDRYGAPNIRAQIGKEREAYLQSLPYLKTLHLYGHHCKFFHGRFTVPHVLWPWDIEKNWEDYCLAFDGGNSDLIGIGDTHWQFQRTQGGTTLFNCGSVGNSLDGCTMAAYSILRLMEDGGYEIVQKRLPYDTEKEIRLAMQAEDLTEPEKYCIEIRSAAYGGRRS